MRGNISDSSPFEQQPLTFDDALAAFDLTDQQTGRQAADQLHLAALEGVARAHLQQLSDAEEWDLPPTLHGLTTATEPLRHLDVSSDMHQQAWSAARFAETQVQQARSNGTDAVVLALVHLHTFASHPYETLLRLPGLPGPHGGLLLTCEAWRPARTGDGREEVRMVTAVNRNGDEVHLTKFRSDGDLQTWQVPADDACVPADQFDHQAAETPPIGRIVNALRRTMGLPVRLADSDPLASMVGWWADVVHRTLDTYGTPYDPELVTEMWVLRPDIIVVQEALLREPNILTEHEAGHQGDVHPEEVHGSGGSHQHQTPLLLRDVLNGTPGAAEFRREIEALAAQFRHNIETQQLMAGLLADVQIHTSNMTDGNMQQQLRLLQRSGPALTYNRYLAGHDLSSTRLLLDDQHLPGWFRQSLQQLVDSIR